MSPQTASGPERIVAASYETHDRRRLIARGDALAILGRNHPARAVVDALPCEGNHKVGYCAGVVVSTDAVLEAIQQQRSKP
jgi:hypothetical protein